MGLLKRFNQKRSLSKRWQQKLGASWSDPDFWFDEMEGGRSDDDTGVRVNTKTALTVSTYWRAMTLLSTYIAKTPFNRHRRSDRKIDRGSLQRLVRKKANKETKAFHFRQTLQFHALHLGNGYAHIKRSQKPTTLGQPVELIQLNPRNVTPVREDGILKYIVTVGGENGGGFDDDTSTLHAVSPANMIHIHGLGFDGLTGYGLLQYAAASLGSAIAKRRFGSRFFKHAATPSVSIEVPNGELSDGAYARLQRSWMSIVSGLNNAHKPLLLEEGAKATPLSFNATDSQLIKAMENDIVVFSNFTGIPTHKLGGKSTRSHNSLESENQSFLDDTLDGWFCPWEEEYDDKLLTEEEKEADSHYHQFNRQSLVRVDMAKRFSAYRTATGGMPWMPGNEVRDLEDMEPIDGLDVVPRPKNMSYPDEPPDDPESQQTVTPPPNDDETDVPAADAENSDERSQVLDQLFERDVRRMAKRLAGAVAKLRKRKLDESSQRLELGADHRDSIVDALEPYGRNAEAVVAEMINAASDHSLSGDELTDAITDAGLAA